jgi:hypothetical protein
MRHWGLPYPRETLVGVFFWILFWFMLNNTPTEDLRKNWAWIAL